MKISRRDLLLTSVAQAIITPIGPGGISLLGPAVLGSVNDTDFPYPTFPYTTLAKFNTVSDIQSHGSGTYINLADPSSPYGGIAIQWTANNANENVLSKTILSTPVDITTGSIRFTFKPNSGLFSGSGFYTFVLGVMSSGTPPGGIPANFSYITNTVWLQEMSTATSTAGGRWQSISIPGVAFINVVGTGANLSAIKWAYLGIGANAAVVEIGNIDFVPNPRTKAAVIFRFDDLYESAYSIAFPILNAAGVPGYIQPGAILSNQGPGNTGRLTIAQIAQMLFVGWQIGSSAGSTEDQATVDGWTASQRFADFQGARTYIKSNFNRYRDSNDGTYFSNNNYTDQISFPQLAQTHRTLQNFLNGNPTNPPLPYGETFPYGDPLNIICLNLAQNGGGGGSNTWQYTQYALDQVRASNGVLILGMHDDLGNSNIVTAINNTITYCQTTWAANMEITTPRRLLAPFCGDPLTG